MIGEVTASPTTSTEAAKRQSEPAATAPVSWTSPFLLRLGHRYAARFRSIVATLAALLAPLLGPPGGVGLCVLVSAAVIGWNAIYLRQMLRTPSTWCWTLDVAIVVALCLAQPILVNPRLQAVSAGWILVVASFTVVAVQWHTKLLPAVVTTAVVTTSFVLGAAADPRVNLAAAVFGASGAWMLAEAALSRTLWILVLRGGGEADEILASQAAAERERVVAVARRTEQREHWAAVHDTAATTLLMVGLGGVRGDEAWLAHQIGRDLITLQGNQLDEAGFVDLVRAVADVVATSPTEASYATSARTLPVPSTVSRAFVGAVGEALENVRRHAGAGSLTAVRLAADDGMVVVEIADRGRGFQPLSVSPRRHGLRWSIAARMEHVGGAAAVHSAPGAGTVVQLSWRDDG